MVNFDIPPPTISGALHMGHIFSYTHIDLILRFNNLYTQTQLGPSLYYKFGIDCNGLPTQKLFEEQKSKFNNNLYDFLKFYKRQYIELFQKMNFIFVQQYQNVEEDCYDTLTLRHRDINGSHFNYLEFVNRVCEKLFFNDDIYVKNDQIYVRTVKYKASILKQAEEINWHPSEMFEKIRVWIENLNEDWCISRQREAGVRMPFAYLTCENRNIKNKLVLVYKEYDGFGGRFKPTMYHFMSENFHDLPLRKISTNYQEDIITYVIASDSTFNNIEFKEGDIIEINFLDYRFDTWFISSLTPWFPISGENYLCKARFQSHEIIRTWAFYSIVQGLLYFKEPAIPWENIVISGWCLTNDNEKMSKSLGGNTDPNVYIEKYGSDAIRYWAGKATLGKDTKLDEEVIKNGKKLCTKIINANKFVAYCLSDQIIESWKKKESEKSISSKIKNFFEGSSLKKKIEVLRSLKKEDFARVSARDDEIKLNLQSLAMIDCWILHLAFDTLEKFIDAFEEFRYDKALELLENFFYKDFCDNYLEFCKRRAYWQDDVTEKEFIAVRYTLDFVSSIIMQLFTIFFPETTKSLDLTHLSLVQRDASFGYYRDNILMKDMIEIVDLHKMESELLFQQERVDEEMPSFLYIVSQIRKLRSLHSLSFSKKINVTITCNAKVQEFLAESKDLYFAINTKNIKFINTSAENIVVECEEVNS